MVTCPAWKLVRESVCREQDRPDHRHTGQDGSYLAEFLLRKRYRVAGIVRRCSIFNRGRIECLYPEDRAKGSLELLDDDPCDSNSLRKALGKHQPDEVHNLAAQSHVQVSFEVPEYTADTDAVGVIRLPDAVRETTPSARFYQASTSEPYGKAAGAPQREDTPFHPGSPCGVARLCADWIVKTCREAYGLYACNSVLFNQNPRDAGRTS